MKKIQICILTGVYPKISCHISRHKLYKDPFAFHRRNTKIIIIYFKGLTQNDTKSKMCVCVCKKIKNLAKPCLNERYI
jgi:hypothetical protein